MLLEIRSFATRKNNTRRYFRLCDDFCSGLAPLSERRPRLQPRSTQAHLLSHSPLSPK